MFNYRLENSLVLGLMTWPIWIPVSQPWWNDMKMTCWAFFTLLILYHFLRFMPCHAFLWQWQLGSRDHRSSYVCGSARLASGWRSFCWALLLWLWSCWSFIVPTSRPRLTAFSWAITSLEQQCNLIKLMVKLHKLTALVKWINSKTKCRCVEVLGLSAIIWSVDKRSSIYQLYVDEPYPTYNQVGWTKQVSNVDAQIFTRTANQEACQLHLSEQTVLSYTAYILRCCCWHSNSHPFVNGTPGLSHAGSTANTVYCIYIYEIIYVDPKNGKKMASNSHPKTDYSVHSWDVKYSGTEFWLETILFAQMSHL